MNSKQEEKNTTEGFWSGLDESDEDFETLIGIGQSKEDKHPSEITNNSVLEDFDKVQNVTEEEIKSLEKEKLNDNEEIVEKDTNSLEDNNEFTTSRNDQEIIKSISEKDTNILEDNNNSPDVKEDNNNSLDIKQQESTLLTETNVFINPPIVDKSEPPAFEKENKLLSTEKMDFLWEDEEDEFVFIPPIKKKEDTKTIDKVLKVPVDNVNLINQPETFNSTIIQSVEPIQENTPILPPLTVPSTPEDTVSKDHHNFKPSFPLKKEIKNPKKTTNKFEFNIQYPKVCFINKFIMSHVNIKQKRRNQKGEYVEKEGTVTTFYYFTITPFINAQLSLENIIQIDNEYDKIIQLLSLKDPHVDKLCSVLSIKDVIYSNNSYSENYDFIDVNTIIDLSLTDKEIAIDYACKKSMWSFALLISNNRSDVIQQFLERTCNKEMVPLALSVFAKIEEKNILIDSDWKKYLKHLFRIPFGNLHYSFIQNMYNSDRLNLYVFFVSLHLLKLADIGDFKTFYGNNLYFLQVVFYINKNISPVKDIDCILYTYIKIVYDFNKEEAETFYKDNKKMFTGEIQNSLDKMFNVNNWGFKDVLNFGISKILNVEEQVNKDTQPINREFKKPVSPKINKSINEIGNKTYSDFQPMNNSIPTKEVINTNLNVQESSKSTVEVQNEHKSLYSEQQHSKSFADIMELEKLQTENVSDKDTTTFLSQYSMDDDEIGISKRKEVKEEETSKSFFSMFNIFKKPVYKVELEASDDIKYDPVTKKWVSGGVQSAPPEIKKVPIKAVPLPSKNNPASKSSVDLSSMSLYANKKPLSKSVIPCIPKKPSDKNNQNEK